LEILVLATKLSKSERTNIKQSQALFPKKRPLRLCPTSDCTNVAETIFLQEIFPSVLLDLSKLENYLELEKILEGLRCEQVQLTINYSLPRLPVDLLRKVKPEKLTLVSQTDYTFLPVATELLSVCEHLQLNSGKWILQPCHSLRKLDCVDADVRLSDHSALSEIYLQDAQIQSGRSALEQLKVISFRTKEHRSTPYESMLKKFFMS
jgi:hypothetical protein